MHTIQWVFESLLGLFFAAALDQLSSKALCAVCCNLEKNARDSD